MVVLMRLLAVSDAFIVARMVTLLVVSFTLLVVIISERLRRGELVQKAVKAETQTIETELAKACDALETCREYAKVQSAELLKRNQKILRLESKHGGSLESI